MGTLCTKPSTTQSRLEVDQRIQVEGKAPAVAIDAKAHQFLQGPGEPPTPRQSLRRRHRPRARSGGCGGTLEARGEPPRVTRSHGTTSLRGISARRTGLTRPTGHLISSTSPSSDASDLSGARWVMQHKKKKGQPFRTAPFTLPILVAISDRASSGG